MDIEKLPDSLLKGKFLHCQPVEDGTTVAAPIFPTNGELPTARVIIVCPARQASSKCGIRMAAGVEDNKCQYFSGDSLGEYQIIGPGMDRKLDTGWE